MSPCPAWMFGRTSPSLNVQLNTLSFQAVSEDRERAVQRAAHVRLNVALDSHSRQSQHSAEDSAAGLYRLLNLLEILREGSPCSSFRIDIDKIC